MSKVIRRGDFQGLKSLLESGDISQNHYDLLRGRLEEEDVVVELIESTWGEITINNVVKEEAADGQ